MTKSTNDLNSNSEREDSSIGISKDNLQFIEQIGEGKFNTGKLNVLAEKKDYVCGFSFQSFVSNETE
jgi:hypothetical protein